MPAQIKLHTFNPFDPNSTIGFVICFKAFCNKNGAHKGATMWKLYFLIRKTLTAAPNALLSAECTGKKNTRYSSGKRGTLASIHRKHYFWWKVSDRWNHCEDDIQQFVLCTTVRHDVVSVCERTGDENRPVWKNVWRIRAQQDLWWSFRCLGPP